MRAPKVILFGAVLLFATIAVLAMMKSKKEERATSSQDLAIVEELIIEPEKNEKSEESAVSSERIALQVESSQEPKEEDMVIPEVDIINRLFSLDSSKLPIVETITYTSRVPWMKGRPAWVADYASHYSTSRHFIARSLNRKADYFSQKVSPGDRFNVFRTDKNIEFRLVIDLSRFKMCFYYYDKDTNERVLLKTYTVGLGREDKSKLSGYLTPTGKYQLGSKVAVYKPGTMGYFQDQKVEMIRVFGTRWIPFAAEVDNCSESYRGYGIHGSPWTMDVDGSLVEDNSHIGKYDSDGCIRLPSKDIEELFSIIITKPTVVELVKDFRDAELPGEEITLGEVR